MLIDFSKESYFVKLKKDMKIDENFKPQYTPPTNNSHYEIKDIETAVKAGKDVEITIDKLNYSKEDPTLRVGKENIVLYIKDQYTPARNEYKYHISWCDTLQQRKDDGKIERYVVTKKNTEYFTVNLYDKNTHKLIESNSSQKMRVCRGCLKKLNYKNYANVTKYQKDKIYNEFSLKEFLEKYSPDFESNEKELKNSTIQATNEYPSNWTKISRAYRIKANWKCEKCGLDCSDKEDFLDAHHINSNKFDVRDENLMALCKRCHAKEHGREYVEEASVTRKEIDLDSIINKVRTGEISNIESIRKLSR